MKKLLPLTLIVLSLFVLSACQRNQDEELSKFINEGAPDPAEILLRDKPTMPEFDQTTPPEKGEQIAVIKTNHGTIKVRLFPEIAPKTVENFIGLIDKGYYNGISFHRVIPDFMIQGGDPTGTGAGGESLWGGTFEDEFDTRLSNIRGALSMANRGPNTNSSQFFIVQAPETSWLNGRHTVFGQVFEGIDVVDEIVNVERDSGDKPLKDVVMEKVTVETF